MGLTISELIDELQTLKRKYGKDMYVANEWGDPLVKVGTEDYMVRHRHDEDGDEITVVELEFYPVRETVRSDD